VFAGPKPKSYGPPSMELWALLDGSTPTTDGILGGAVDVYLGEKEARRALAEILAHEPGGWRS
jgi:hypothetical protein